MNGRVELLVNLNERVLVINILEDAIQVVDRNSEQVVHVLRLINGKHLSVQDSTNPVIQQLVASNYIRLSNTEHCVKIVPWCIDAVNRFSVVDKDCVIHRIVTENNCEILIEKRMNLYNISITSTVTKGLLAEFTLTDRGKILKGRGGYHKEYNRLVKQGVILVNNESVSIPAID